MHCFVFARLKVLPIMLSVLFASEFCVSASQQCFASDWVDLLKPLVTNVIVPGASMGMKKLIQHEERVHPELTGKLDTKGTSASSLTETGKPSSTANAQFFENNVPDASFSSPEEPISSNVNGASSSEYWAAVHNTSASEPAPPPPPPVSTPD